MKQPGELLRDRQRRQRGSVLSGVLIIVAFLSLIAGAIMTQLSTNFLISRHLVTRVVTEATVDSAVESTIYQMQATPLDSGCPTPPQVSLNGATAAASFLSCAPVVDSHSPQFVQVASSQPFTTDGTHVVLPSTGTNEYLVSDRNGEVYAFPFGSSAWAWRYGLPGTLTGPPNAMPDLSDSPATLLDLVPIASSSCGTPAYCVGVLGESPGQRPQLQCFMQANARVSVRPLEGVNLPGVAFFGDQTGTVYAYAPEGGSNCAELASLSVGSQPITGGVAVFAGAVDRRQANDELFVIESDGMSSQLLHLTFGLGRRLNGFQLDSVLTLPAASAVGLAMQSATLPARLVVTFAEGQVAMLQIGADFSMSLVRTASIGTEIAASPFWCKCSAGDEIGVGGRNGLYVFDSGLNSYASFAVTGTAINAAPAADGAGDWFFGTDGGYVVEVQKGPGQSMAQAAQFGALGSRISSSITLAGCPTGLCIYTATSSGDAFLIDLDARDAVVTACITSSPTSCNSVNPRLWARVEVGAMGNPGTVHVSGWSYYSP